MKLLKSQSSETGIVFIYLDEAGLLATTFVLEVSNSDRDIMASERERKKKDASYERDTWVTTILKAKVSTSPPFHSPLLTLTSSYIFFVHLFSSIVIFHSLAQVCLMILDEELT